MSRFLSRRSPAASEDGFKEEDEIRLVGNLVQDPTEFLDQSPSKSGVRDSPEAFVQEEPEVLDQLSRVTPVQSYSGPVKAPHTPQQKVNAAPRNGADHVSTHDDISALELPAANMAPSTAPRSYTIAPDDCFKDVCVNIMVSGMSGLGKTTCIKNMLKDLLPEEPPHDGSSTSLEMFIKRPDELILQSQPTIFPEKGCRVTYRIQDTPGWGDQVDIQRSIDAIIAHVQGRKKREMQAWDGNLYEPRDIEYKYMLDACLYFIPPHRFTEIDAFFIHQLSREVTVIPIIAKADSMTIDETLSFKQFVLDTLEEWSGDSVHSILSELEGTLSEINRSPGALGQVPPFSIIGSQHFDESDQPVRRYAWGECQSWNENHSDFSKLKRLLLTTGMHGLRTRRHEFYVRYTVEVRANKHLRTAEAASEAASAAARTVRETVEARNKPKWTELVQKVTAYEQQTQVESDSAKRLAKQAIELVATSCMRTEEAKRLLKAAEEEAKRAEDHKKEAEACAGVIAHQLTPRKKSLSNVFLRHSSSKAL